MIKNLSKTVSTVSFLRLSSCEPTPAMRPVRLTIDFLISMKSCDILLSDLLNSPSSEARSAFVFPCVLSSASANLALSSCFLSALVVYPREDAPFLVSALLQVSRFHWLLSTMWGSRGSVSGRALDFGLIGVSTCGFKSHQGPFRSLTFPPVLRDWVIKGLGMSSLVSATGHIKDPVPLIEKRRGLSSPD